MCTFVRGFVLQRRRTGGFENLYKDFKGMRDGAGKLCAACVDVVERRGAAIKLAGLVSDGWVEECG